MNHRLSRFLSGWLAVLLLSAGSGFAQTAPTRAERAARLRDLLEKKQPVKVLAYGDSISFGYGCANALEQSFPVLVTRALRDQFGDAEVTLENISDPGCTAVNAVNYLTSHAISAQPDLAIVQFGGNDSRTDVTPQHFYDAITEIVTQLRAQTPALVLLCVQPFEDKFSDFSIISMLRQVSRDQDVACADFDAVLKARPHDFRGLFPWGNHPSEYDHAVMARTVYHVLQQELRVPVALRLDQHDQAALLAPHAKVPVTVSVRDDGAAAEEVKLAWQTSAQTDAASLQVAPGATAAWTTMLPQPSGSRGAREMVWFSARGADGSYDFLVRWVHSSPVLGVGDGAISGPVISLIPAPTGGKKQITPQDCSVSFHADRTNTDLHLVAEITDDHIVSDNQGDPYQSDCLELFFDARPADAQGQPFFAGNTAVLFVNPYETAPRIVRVSPEGTDGIWSQVSASCKRHAGGYDLDVTVPLAALRLSDGTLPSFIGFDFAVDDADDSTGRKAQLMWSGTGRDFLIPSLFGALQFTNTPSQLRRVVIW